MCETGAGVVFSGSASGAVSEALFSGLATNFKDGGAIWDGFRYGALSGAVGSFVGGAIGGGVGASNLTSQLLYNDGDFSSINWSSVGLSGLSSYGMYHAVSYTNWQFRGGKKFGDVDLKYSAYNKLNATMTRAKTLRREQGGWITDGGKFKRLNGAYRTKTSIDMSNVKAPEGAKYLVHTHYHSENINYPIGDGKTISYNPYEPSDPQDYFQLDRYGVKGAILTNQNLLLFQTKPASYDNNYSYPLTRYLPSHFWW